VAHAGSAEVAVTVDWVNVAQKVEAAALLLMYDAQALVSALRQASAAGARKRRW